MLNRQVLSHRCLSYHYPKRHINSQRNLVELAILFAEILHFRAFQNVEHSTMGGGAAMRAAARAAGIGVVAGGLRGVPGVSVGESTISAAVGKTSRPVSPTLSASTVHSDALSAQRLSWETDDWEFAGGEEEWVVGSADPLPRLVFGGAPSLQEAREATSELKEALET